MSGVHPKFKVLDTISDGGSNVWQVVFIGNFQYFLRDSTGKVEGSLSISTVDKTYELYEQEITLTKRKLAEAWDKSFNEGLLQESKTSLSFAKLSKELGFTL